METWFKVVVESGKSGGEKKHRENVAKYGLSIFIKNQANQIYFLLAYPKATQADFAYMIGVSVATLRNWEQGRRRPEGPALALLKIVSKIPEYVEQILTV